MVSTNVLSQMAAWLDEDQAEALGPRRPTTDRRSAPRRNANSSERYATTRRHSRTRSSSTNLGVKRRLRKPMGV